MPRAPPRTRARGPRQPVGPPTPCRWARPRCCSPTTTPVRAPRRQPRLPLLRGRVEGRGVARRDRHDRHGPFAARHQDEDGSHRGAGVGHRRAADQHGGDASRARRGPRARPPRLERRAHPPRASRSGRTAARGFLAIPGIAAGRRSATRDRAGVEAALTREAPGRALGVPWTRSRARARAARRSRTARRPRASRERDLLARSRRVPRLRVNGAGKGRSPRPG